ISVESKTTDTCSLMAWGYNPYIAEKSPYHSAYLAVVESVSKLIAAGGQFKDVYLTFQEYFEKPLKDGTRWGKPFAALLGAFMAQKDLEIGSIGGKDSMSGSFEKLDVPPTLVSFAVTTDKTENIISPEFKKAGHNVVLIKPEYDSDNLPVAESLKSVYNTVSTLVREKKVVAAYTPTYGGIAEAVMKMAFGNDIGFAFNDKLSLNDIFGYCYGGFLLEVTEDVCVGEVIGTTTDCKCISYNGSKVCLGKLLEIYENKLEPIFSCNIPTENKEIPAFSYKAESYPTPKVSFAKPKVIIPVFPGTNCEYDTAKVMNLAGAQSEIIVINNLSAQGISQSIEYFAQKLKESQIVFIPGGFSGGDEPDGSGKFITAFFRNAAIKDGVADLLENRDGLMCGICNGFQALVKLGLVPYGKIIDTNENDPTLTFNTISRHQSRLVRTRIASNKSPWLSATQVGDVYTVPISHGEGRFYANDEVIAKLAANGQIATQYVDFDGVPTDNIRFNPNNSAFAIEGITSPDGRVFGKMGHSERTASDLYKNVCGIYDMKMFESAVKYFK
ncbi:MAG: phosphoribosylformylglycinamidine synthase subunit PurQ, partial [Clostridia bacterium]|nr:phosphoribosylformylglycinamidine synthase subunit PurQ [Clostridia bacterium]